jgi:hypothetical protein
MFSKFISFFRFLSRDQFLQLSVPMSVHHQDRCELRPFLDNFLIAQRKKSSVLCAGETSSEIEL